MTRSGHWASSKSSLTLDGTLACIFRWNQVARKMGLQYDLVSVFNTRLQGHTSRCESSPVVLYMEGRHVRLPPRFHVLRLTCQGRN